MTYTRIPKKEERHLVLIDIENLAASPSPTCDEVTAVATALCELVPGFAQAQRIVACSHHAAAAVAFNFPPARHLWRSGPDGADLALLNVLDNERIDDRFGHVTICSGDGIFATSAARLGGAGVDVTAVALNGHLSVRLHLAARNVIFLTPRVEQAFRSAS